MTLVQRKDESFRPIRIICRRSFWQTFSLHRSWLKLTLFGLIVLFVLQTILQFDKGGTASTTTTTLQTDFTPWNEGLLDIHHLQVGSSVATLCIFPDGTNLLIDAGDKNHSGVPSETAQKIQPPFPNSDKNVAEWILDYLQNFLQLNHLDYVLITHFHSDHMGGANDGERPLSKSRSFRKTGIAWIAEVLPIGTMIDRNFPQYNFPVNLHNYTDDMRNYLAFVDAYKHQIKFQGFQVGSYNQIHPLHTRKTKSDENENGISFIVRNIKANLDFSPALPDNSHVFAIPDTSQLVMGGKWNENKLATAVVVEYGKFSYYNGADQEHRDFEGSAQIDTVTPVAMAAGNVNVATLNHHGYGTNDAYFKYLNPNVLVLPGWHQNHPPKVVSPTLLRHGQARHWFSTFVHARNKVTNDGDIAWDSPNGHIVVRVYPPDTTANRQEYQVFVLDGNRKIRSTHGPFTA